MAKHEVKDLETFIIKAREVHGEQYDYSLVVYTRARDKVDIRCIKHDLVFRQTPNSHTSAKQGCPKCAKEKTSSTFKKSRQYYIDRANEQFNHFYDYSLIPEEPFAKEKVKIVCPTHGIFEKQLSAHVHGAGCPVCSKKVQSFKSRLPQQDYIERAISVHGNRYDYSLTEYAGKGKYIKIICKIHGVFEQRADHHINTEGCPDCMLLKKGDLYRFSNEEFISRSKEVHGDKYDYSLVKYINQHTKVPIICKIHGVFEQVPSSHLYAAGCPMCSTQKVGYRANMAGTFYILKVTEDIYKFGITNNFNKRFRMISNKSTYKLEPLYTFHCGNGYIIRKIESEVIYSGIERNVVNREDMYSGYTETFYAKDLQIVLAIVNKHMPS